MLRPRIIPCLLVHNGGLVKTRGFTDHKYVGDPINAVRIFNEKEVDELLVLDIDATVTKVGPDFSLISKLAAECRMPLCYGGGISSIIQAERLIGLGVEKVAISAGAMINHSLVASLATGLGSQSVVIVIDVRRNPKRDSGDYDVCTHNGTNIHEADILTLVEKFQNLGAGEIVINSIDRDGQMQGYDIELAKQVKKIARVPITFLGGAGSLDHMSDLISNVGIVGLAAGSLFVFKGKYRAVLINHPTLDQKKQLYHNLKNS